MKPILEIQNIGKKFKIQHENLPYLSLRDSIKLIFKKNTSTEDFWALQDVSFNVMPGDSIGIIGKNGAGKSTLLKILSKITPPTKGQIIGRGRIASLLEVGTGFHPELSGRENIFMNGSILGMKRFEIAKNFDAIVDFAGVERFLDEPLKHYSSGMQLRLAFAVAAFLENEILIIDEVLAVGDAEFQKKCMGKMDDVSKSGRTILFVSHNLGAVSQLCKKGIYLQNGTLTSIGNVSDVINNYLSNNDNEDSNVYLCPESKNKECFFYELKTITGFNEPNVNFGFNENIILHIHINVKNLLDVDCKISITLLDKFQARVFTTVRKLSELANLNTNEIILKVSIPKNLIAPNKYSFRYALFNDAGKVYDLLEGVNNIKIIDTGTIMTKYEGVDYGSVIMECDWIHVKNIK